MKIPSARIAEGIMDTALANRFSISKGLAKSQVQFGLAAQRFHVCHSSEVPGGEGTEAEYSHEIIVGSGSPELAITR